MFLGTLSIALSKQFTFKALWRTMIASLGNHLKNITTSVLLKTGRNFASLFFSSLVNT